MARRFILSYNTMSNLSSGNMQEQGNLESSQGKNPIPVGSRSAWISLHWEKQGAERTHDFSTVQELAQFLQLNPGLGKLFGYTRKR